MNKTYAKLFFIFILSNYAIGMNIPLDEQSSSSSDTDLSPETAIRKTKNRHQFKLVTDTKPEYIARREITQRELEEYGQRYQPELMAVLGNLNRLDLTTKQNDTNSQDTLSNLPTCPTCYKFLSAQSPEWRLLRATEAGSLEEVKRALAEGACAWFQDPTDNLTTPLHIAVKKGYPEIAKVLILSGSDPKAKDRDRVTPFKIAQDNGRHDMVKILQWPASQVSTNTSNR
jgi:hypothetical protein